MVVMQNWQTKLPDFISSFQFICENSIQKLQLKNYCVVDEVVIVPFLWFKYLDLPKNNNGYLSLNLFLNLNNKIKLRVVSGNESESGTRNGGEDRGWTKFHRVTNRGQGWDSRTRSGPGPWNGGGVLYWLAAVFFIEEEICQRKEMKG